MYVDVLLSLPLCHVCSRDMFFYVNSDYNYFVIYNFFIQESFSPRPRSTSCWFTTPMPSSTIRNTVMLPASTAWHCNRRKSSAKHLKFVLLPVELHLTYRPRWVRPRLHFFKCTYTILCVHPNYACRLRD